LTLQLRPTLHVRRPLPQRETAQRQGTYATVLRCRILDPSLLIIDEDD